MQRLYYSLFKAMSSLSVENALKPSPAGEGGVRRNKTIPFFFNILL